MREHAVNDYFYAGSDPALDDPVRGATEPEPAAADDADTVTVRPRDGTFTMTFDRDGALVDFAFVGTRYRNLAPAELAHLVLETARAGWTQSMELAKQRLDATMPAFDLKGVLDGEVPARQELERMVGSGLSLPWSGTRSGGQPA